MKRNFPSLLALAVLAAAGIETSGATLLTNGNLDATQQVEIVPGFFLPKPADWENVGSRSIAGPYEDDMTSEPWSGPSPTPVTPGDNGVFFKPFTGSAMQGLATAHLYQDISANVGLSYTLTGWAGAESNALGDFYFAIDFLGVGNVLIGGAELYLNDAGLFVDNGLAFDYKQYSVQAVAPVGTVTVRARISMVDTQANPMGGGQAFVVDDFELTAVPEPSVALLGVAGVAGLLFRRPRRLV